MRNNADERPILIGALVRRRTMASNGWIASRLWMGDASRVSCYCANGRSLSDRAFLKKFDELDQCTRSLTTPITQSNCYAATCAAAGSATV